MSTTFTLATFRRPLAPALGNLVAATFGLLVAGFVAAYPLIVLVGLAPWLAIAISESVAIAALVAIAWSDHAPQPAGSIRIEEGRLRFDAWRRAPVDVPITDVQKAMILQHGDARHDVLVVSLASQPKLLVHAPRLEPGATLEDVLLAIDDALQSAGAAPDVRAASQRAAQAETKRQRFVALAGVVLVAAMILRALAVMLTE
ncbi:hypothetical protein [Sandaracinus amylolyticus]|uniref:Uncharacterized protein n=1 Tax=Sandaracinus amylolyticus TaxID=927083 RepID=A0A0F6SDN3_9BACT|nr:hypothetical protein [Sandaracinus amylolyticus]AKF03744.1 hypothetical protein DB32_000893 [Sandaracinus amylolyticus]